MRISFRSQYDSYLSDLGRAESSYFDAQRQVASGKRIQSVGDDPFGTTASLNMRSLRAGLEQYGDNLGSAQGQLKIAEGSLDELGKLLRRAGEIAISGANGATSQAGRQAMAQEVESITKRLVELGNTQGPSGQFLFAGQTNDEKPFNLVGSTLEYRGDDLNVFVEVSASDTMAVNVKAQQTIQDVFGALQGLKNSLEGGNTANLSGVNLPAVQELEKRVQLVRGDVGARLSSIESLQNQHLRRTDELTAQISNVEDVDMSEAILHYKQAETAYQAALQTISASSRLTLMDFMR